MRKAFRYSILVASLFGIAATLLAAVIRERPTAQSNGSDIVIRWATEDERGVERYDILRRAGTTGDFVTVGTERPKGNYSTYEYTDRSVFKAQGGVYQYKVRIVISQGSPLETEIVTVSFLSSAAKRTWGSIKAMFR